MQILQHKLFDDAMNEANLLPAFRAIHNADESSARCATARQLVAVMRMCLQHDPEKRPQTGTDVLRLLLRDDEDLPAELLAPPLSWASASSASDMIEVARSGAHNKCAEPSPARPDPTGSAERGPAVTEHFNGAQLTGASEFQ